MHIKTIMSHHFTPSRMAAAKKPENPKCWLGDGEIGTPGALLVGMQGGAATMENSTAVPQRVLKGHYHGSQQ